MSKLKSRHIREMLYILDLQYPVSTAKISEEIGVKKRTLKEDLNIIYNFFFSKGLNLIRKPKIGVYLKCNSQATIKRIKSELFLLHKSINLDREDRFKKIFTDCIIKDKIPTIEDWCFEINISRPTVMRDLKRVKTYFKENELILEGKPGIGYKLKGNEESIRNTIVDFILRANKNKTNKLIEKIFNNSETKEVDAYSLLLIKNIQFSEIKTFLDNIQKGTDTVLVDKDYAVFVLKVAVFISRIKDKHFVIIESKKLFNIMQTPAYGVIYKNIHIIEDSYYIKIPPEEIAYITLSFLSSKIQEFYSLQQKCISYKSSDEKYSEYAKIVVQITNDIFEFSIPDEAEFIRMLALHLKSMLTKIKYTVKIENPLLKDIKVQYPLLFSVAERVTMMLGRQVHIEIPEEEAGYIAMYLAMAVEKARHQKRKRKKVVVICAMAMATSSLLFWKLLNEMPDIDVVQVGSYKDILEGKIDLDIDLIISTIPLPQLNIPHVVISPFLSTKEKEVIRKILGIAKYKLEYPSVLGIENVLEEKLIFVNIELKNSKEVIKLLGGALIKNKYVKNDFVKAVIEREKQFPTGLDTPIPIALPHTDANFTLKKGFAIATLKHSVTFKSMGGSGKILPIRIVLIPVLTQKSEDNIIFYELLKKCRDSKMAHELLKCNSSEEIKKILTKTFVS